MYKKFIKPIVAMTFIMLLFTISFASSTKNYNIQKDSIVLARVNNSVVQITGNTNSHYIKLNRCKNNSIIFNNCTINSNSRIPLQLNSCSINAIFEGNNYMQSPECIYLFNSNLFLKRGTVFLDGDLRSVGRSKLSISNNATLKLISKSTDILSPLNIDTGANLSSILYVQLQNDSIPKESSKIEIKNVATNDIKSITMPPDYRSFAISLPNGTYSVSRIDKDGSKVYSSLGEFNVSGFTQKCEVSFKLKELAIDAVKTTPPSKYNGNNGKITICVSGGSGKYQFSLNNKTQSTCHFTGLPAGNYIAKVKDTVTKNVVEEEISITNPLSAEIKEISVNGKLMEETTNEGIQEFIKIVPYGEEFAQLSLNLVDDRAIVHSDSDLNHVPLQCGSNTIPIKIYADKIVTPYKIIIKRMPPSPQCNLHSNQWYPAPTIAKLWTSENSCSVFHSLNGGNYKEGKEISINNSGITLLRTYSVIDGVKSEESTFKIKLDTESPVITSAVAEKNEQNNLECAIHAKDTQSGLDYITYETEDLKTQTIKFSSDVATFTLDENYSGDILITATDNCSNTSKKYVIEDIVIDKEKPRIMSISPANETTANSLTPPKIEFNEEMILGKGNILIRKDDGEFTKIDKAFISISGNTAILNMNLCYDSQYEITVEPNAFTDKAGNSINLKVPLKWIFFTPISPSDSSLIYLGVSNNNLDFSPAKQYYSLKADADNDCILNIIPKNRNSKVQTSLYSEGKFTKTLAQNKKHEYCIDKNLLKHKNKRIIIDVTSQNGYNTTSYVVDLVGENDIAHIDNNTNIDVHCYGLNNAQDLTPSIEQDKGAHFSLNLKDISKENLPKLVQQEITERFPSFQYSAVEIGVNEVISNHVKPLDKFSPITVVMNFQPNQKAFMVIDSINIKSMLAQKSPTLVPLEDMDSSTDTVSFKLNEPEKIIIINAKTQNNSSGNSSRSSKTHRHQNAKRGKNTFILGAYESITGDKLNYLIQNDIPLVVRINGKDIAVNLDNIPPEIRQSPKLNYKDILSAYRLETKVDNPNTGCE